MKNIKNFAGEINSKEGEYIENKEIEQEQGLEQQEEEVEFEAGTLADFIEYLKKRHQESDNMEEKQDINRHKLNIVLGLQSANLDAKTVKVKVLPDGVLGACAINENGRPIMISKSFLEDFKSNQAKITAVLVHENIHHEGIYDEGLTMIKTKKEVANSPEAYTAEQGKARRTFSKLTVEKLWIFMTWIIRKN
jgi:hypothetical protein